MTKQGRIYWTKERMQKAIRRRAAKSKPAPLQELLVPAENFVATLAANVDNADLSDADFRKLVKNTLPIVSYPRQNTL